MFKNLRIGVRLGIGFGLMVLLLATVSLTAYMRMSQINTDLADVVNEKFPKTIWANNVVNNINVIARALRNSLLVNPEQVQGELDRVADARKKITENFDKLEKSIHSEEGMKKLAIALEARKIFVEEQTKFLELQKSGKRDEAVELMVSSMRKTQGEYIKAVQGLVDFQSELMKTTGEEARVAAEGAQRLIAILSISAILIAIGFAFWVTRSITEPLHQAVDVANALAEGDLTVKIEVSSKDETGRLLSAMQAMVGKLSQIVGEIRASATNLSSASEEVSATAQSMSQATNEQAASVEETSASVEQMGASINQNSENAKVTDGMAAQAAMQATEGGVAVKETVSAMKQIAGKIGIIDDIAYQTNLLALNAAIEAARAGDHGKGFAVVAAEVRKLAERSQIAAQEIGELASGSVSKAEEAGKLLDEIVPAINKTSDLVQEITAASEEQSSGAAQINTAMNQLNSITQQNASSSEELAATAEEMSASAEQLQELVGFFNVGGSGISVAKLFVSHADVNKPAKKPLKPTTKHVFAHAAHDETEFVKF